MQTYTNENLRWIYNEPAPLNKKILLLTIHNICVVGVWKGDPLPNNKAFKAWQGLPARDKEQEKLLGHL